MFVRSLVYYIFISFRVLFVNLQESELPPEPEKELKEYDWNVWCKLQPNGNDCTKKEAFLSRFYYDIILEDCKTFSYGRCEAAINNFDTITQCHETCRDLGVQPLRGNYSDKVKCRLQPDFGDCNEYHPMFYYDIVERRCKGFSFSGCGGNDNRFKNAQMCASVCIKLMETEVN